MIPKIIHYCWFGGAEKPESVQKCISSWRKYCPDYKIQEWTEADFDVSQNLYCKQAYEAKAWGFVPDYIRLWIVYQYGGIYLDTDVQLLQNLDSLLNLPAFMGFEKDTGNYVNLGQGFGAEPGNRFIADNMHRYDDIVFKYNDGTYNKTPSPVYTTEVLVKHGLDKIQSTQIQTLKHVTVYPADFFCPKSFCTGVIQRTKNTYSIHHFDASWYSDDQQEDKKARWKRERRSYLLHYPCRVAQRVLGMERYLKIRGFLQGERSDETHE